MNIKTSSGFLSLIIGLSVIALGGPSLSAKDTPPANPPLRLLVDDKPIDRDSFDRVSYAAVVKKVAPSVVRVYSTKKVSARENPLNDPMFRHFFGMPDQGDNPPGEAPGRHHPREFKEQGLGSGVIVSSNGYILTNNHVVEGASEVKVAVGEGRTEYEAKVIGRDARVDVAVLKIEATGLPAAIMGDSDQLQVGDTVMAIGIPFGVGLSVTHGIVSAVGRGLESPDRLEDFIQTDAAINPGNSGGALVDSSGRVVGINTAILSNSGGSNGVGFAIPINMVSAIADQLVRTGHVERGYLGIMMQELTDDLAKQFGAGQGALVTEVKPDSPADKAGLKSGDIITRLNGAPIIDMRHLQLMIVQLAPGTVVSVEYLRDGKSAVTKAKLGLFPSQSLAENGVSPKKDEGVLNGVSVSDITPEVREQLQIPDNIKGALVSEVEADSASAGVGIAQGDVILSLDQKEVHNADEAVKLSDEIKGPKVLVRLWRKGSSRFLVVDESKKDTGDAPAQDDESP